MAHYVAEQYTFRSNLARVLAVRNQNSSCTILTGSGRYFAAQLARQNGLVVRPSRQRQDLAIFNRAAFGPLVNWDY